MEPTSIHQFKLQQQILNITIEVEVREKLFRWRVRCSRGGETIYDSGVTTEKILIFRPDGSSVPIMISSSPFEHDAEAFQPYVLTAIGDKRVTYL